MKYNHLIEVWNSLSYAERQEQKVKKLKKKVKKLKKKVRELQNGG